MWQAFIIIFLAAGWLFATDAKNVSRKLTQDFPYGLLTDDYGILNYNDLKINACIAEPAPYLTILNKAYAYPYWQCFEAKKIEMICEIGRIDSDKKLRMSMLVISGRRNDEHHEFISRRPIPLTSCQLYKKDWQKYTSGEMHVCVAGSVPSSENEERKIVWIFNRYKTKKGCDSYFDRECDLQYQLENHLCVSK